VAIARLLQQQLIVKRNSKELTSDLAKKPQEQTNKISQVCIQLSENPNIKKLLNLLS
jgi:hypothetical protein